LGGKGKKKDARYLMNKTKQGFAACAREERKKVKSGRKCAVGGKKGEERKKRRG